MSVFRDHWLRVHCKCGHIANNPIRLMMQDDSGGGARTLAETVVRTRCAACGERPVKIYLTTENCGPNVTGGATGCSILLHPEPGGVEAF
jgi:hypothetical protein